MSQPILCTDGHSIGDKFPGFRAIIAQKFGTLPNISLNETEDRKTLEKVFEAFRVDKCEHCRIILLTEKVDVI